MNDKRRNHDATSHVIDVLTEGHGNEPKTASAGWPPLSARRVIGSDETVAAAVRRLWRTIRTDQASAAVLPAFLSSLGRAGATSAVRLNSIARG
jgi:hypothetical protein